MTAIAMILIENDDYDDRCAQYKLKIGICLSIRRAHRIAINTIFGNANGFQ